jgi:ATP-binding cassette subfamily B protein
LGNRLREEIFSKVNSFGQSEIKQFSVAGLLTRITGDTAQVRNFFATMVQFLIKAPLMALGAAFKISGTNAILSWATFAAIGMLLVLVIILVFIALPKFKSIQTKTDELNLASRETLTGLRVVRAYNAEKYQEQKFDKANKNLAKTFLSVNRSMGIMFPFISFLMCAVSLANWWIGGLLVQDMGSQEATEFIIQLSVVTQYSIQIIISFVFLVFVMVQLPRAIISAKRINEVLKTNPTIVDGEGISKNIDSKYAIEFNGVNFRYPGAEEFVLKGINLQIKRGERLAFIGSTGCGKSTLVNLIPRLYDATEGEIKLFGHDVKKYTLADVRKAVAYIPQKAMLFKGTVRENIAFGEIGISVTDKEVWQALEIAQGKEFVKKLSNGLQFQIARGGDNLSGGQKQRIAIARGVVRKPDVCIFDDTFSALDYVTDAKVRSALAESMAGTTQIVVAQRIGTIKNMDRIVVLEDGVVVGIGTHKELLKSCKVYKEIALSQLSKEEL